MDLKQHLIYIENHGYYGFNRRVDDFRDKDGNSYTGVIYILSCIWNGNRSEENLIIEELKNGDLIGDPEFAFIEFTFSRALGSLIDRETEDAIDLQLIESMENETFLFNKKIYNYSNSNNYKSNNSKPFRTLFFHKFIKNVTKFIG